MISKVAPKQAYVWIWLPGKADPVVAGALAAVGQDSYQFAYGRSYLARENAIAIYTPELRRAGGPLPLPRGLNMPGSLRDGAPDAWGRRVIINSLTGDKRDNIAAAAVDELTVMLESGSDRIGALDFQASPTQYVPRAVDQATIPELLSAAELVEKGVPLPQELDRALLHASSIGGARPKALIEDGQRKYIAKFSATNDLFNVVKAEHIAMTLAARCGLSVAPVKWMRSARKDVILVERFDRFLQGNAWRRRAMVSALTILALDEMMAKYASYQDLANIIRVRFAHPKTTLRELFGRMVFNVLCGNNDDHARNHAAFWDGQHLSLTPAYDICPQSRTGNQSTQAMLIHGDARDSRIATCLGAAKDFLLTEQEAVALVISQVITIKDHWATACGDVELTEVDRKLFWKRQFLNPFAFENAPEQIRELVAT
ncbi:MAG: type II toxin-antitoxin system HipA family toxin [Devosia sp.]